MRDCKINAPILKQELRALGKIMADHAHAAFAVRLFYSFRTSGYASVCHIDGMKLWMLPEIIQNLAVGNLVVIIVFDEIQL